MQNIIKEALSYRTINQELSRGGDISVINLIDCLIEEAYTERASDIHIDPLQGSLRIRLRIDGLLQDIYNFPNNIHSEIISRIKVLSGPPSTKTCVPVGDSMKSESP